MNLRKIQVRYTVERNSTPMEIHNNMDEIFKKVKKHRSDFEIYPLCITINWTKK